MNIITFEEKRANQTWLQGLGWRNAKPAKELKSGDVTIWNYGFKEIVKSVQFTKSGKSVKCVFVSENGNEYDRTMRADRLVAIEQ